MDKLSPRKGPSYHRLHNKQHNGNSNSRTLPDVKFTTRNSNGKLRFEASDSSDSVQGQFSNSERMGSCEVLQMNDEISGQVQRKQSLSKLPPPSIKTKLLVFICSIVIVVGVILIIHFHEVKPETVTVGNPTLGSAELVLSQKTLNIIDEKQRTRIEISISGENKDLINCQTAQNCGKYESNMEGVCLKFTSANATLEIVPSQLLNVHTKCFNITWTYSKSYEPEDCFYLDNENANEVRGQPVWYDSIQYILWSRMRSGPCVDSCQTYIPTHSRNDLDIGGTVVEPLWLSTHGAVIKASLHSPLEACLKFCKDVSRSKLCLKRKSDVTATADQSSLSYTACFGSNVTEVRSDVMEKIVIPESEKVTDILSGQISGTITKQSTKTLSERCSHLFKNPLWNIALNGESYDNVSVIEEELKDIADIGGTGIVFNISDVYSNLGDFELHSLTNAKAEDFISAMHRMRFKVMLPASPFINYDAKNFRQALREGFLLRNENNEAPVLTDVHMLGVNIYPALIDFTNSKAFSWFVDNVKNSMRKLQVDFMQLLYGQHSWLPEKYQTMRTLTNPAFHSSVYTKVANYLESCPLSDVAFASQSENQVVMLRPAGGLKDSVKVALAAGLAGYPFFIPNLPFKLEEVDMLSSEMLEDGFIRWIQLVSFFPVPHMPWDFHILHKRGVNISRLTECVKKCMAMRNGEAVGPALRHAMEKAEKTRHSPILSPIWMAPQLPTVSNHDFAMERIFYIDDQFMIGPDVMVAPVLDMKVTSRDIYFPPGRWTKLPADLGMPSLESDGGLWKNDFAVSLDEVAVFIRKP